MTKGLFYTYIPVPCVSMIGNDAARLAASYEHSILFLKLLQS